jgi:hypothetical protein
MNSTGIMKVHFRKERCMRNVMVMLLASIVLCGCDTLRFAPKEEQKQNAWLHWRTTQLAAQEAVNENTSAKVQRLTELSAQQSRAFAADYGMPKDSFAMGENMPTRAWAWHPLETQDGAWAWHPLETQDGAWAWHPLETQDGARPWYPSEGFATETAIAQTAYRQSIERPDVWQAADGVVELGIGLAGLFGGAYGIRAAQFLKQARDKSKALKEIIEGNELFRETNPLQASAFKEAQKDQSVETKKIVTETKAQL